MSPPLSSCDDNTEPDGPGMAWDLPGDWKHKLARERTESWFHDLCRFVADERRAHRVFPSPEHVFEALRTTPWEQVRVVLLGQDPYHGPGQAHGLSFSVPPGVPIPPSLRNIFRELESDLKIPFPKHGCLAHWAKQGVLLLNTVLTVRAGQANSHRNRGWETLTDRMIQVVDGSPRPVIFVLWGTSAKKKRSLISAGRNNIIESVHPSPLSAHRGFFGSQPFSRINALLEERNEPPIDWRLPDQATPAS